MSDLKKLGANIRSLRMAYGETQEQLGEAIFVEKNTVSYYENGKREPNKETLIAIAEHYSASVGELLYSDLTGIGKITVDPNAFWKNIDIFLPIISSEKALSNENFKKALDAHKEIFNQLHKASMEGIDKLDICVEGYQAAMEDDEIKAEAAANIIALWFLIMVFIKAVPELLKNKPAYLRQVAARDKETRKVIENVDPSFEAEAKELLDEIDNEEIKNEISEMLTVVKRSKEWSDLADYYLALQYLWNLVDNDLGWGFNQRIGIEMMDAFNSVNNRYVARFLKYNYDALRGASSQSVDDKQ